MTNKSMGQKSVLTLKSALAFFFLSDAVMALRPGKGLFQNFLFRYFPLPPQLVFVALLPPHLLYCEFSHAAKLGRLAVLV